MVEKCSYCGEEGHTIQQCPKWKGREVATATHSTVTVEEMRRALYTMENRIGYMLPESRETKMFEATMFAAKTTMKDATERRVFIQDFAASLNRKRLLTNENVEDFIKYGYIYMEVEHSSNPGRMITYGAFEGWLKERDMTVEQFEALPQLAKDLIYGRFKVEMEKAVT